MSDQHYKITVTTEHDLICKVVVKADEPQNREDFLAVLKDLIQVLESDPMGDKEDAQ